MQWWASTFKNLETLLQDMDYFQQACAEILEEIKKNKAILYDPKVVDACVEIVTRKGFKFEDLT